MSRSIHQTLRGVFGRKSRREVDAMFEEGDADVKALVRKSQLKDQERARRRKQALDEALAAGEEPHTD